MTQPASTTIPRNCPACNAIVLPGRQRCVSCGLPLDKMIQLAAAKAHAARRGFTNTATDAQPNPTKKYLLIAGGATALLLIVVFALLFWRHGVAAAKPWEAYPTNAEVAVTDLFGNIRKGDKPAGYRLISMTQQNPDDSHDIDKWGYVFQDVNDYLTGEFGPAWNAKMVVTPSDPAKGAADTLWVVKIATETLHVEIEPQGPKGGPLPSTPHYGIVAIREFTLDDSNAPDPTRGARSILDNVYGAKGSSEQIGSIGAVFGQHANESAMASKRRLLPLVRNPKSTALNQALYHLWRVRTDDTVRARLDAITKDARYSPEAQGIAQKVLDGTVTDEELIAAHVPG